MNQTLTPRGASSTNRSRRASLTKCMILIIVSLLLFPLLATVTPVTAAQESAQGTVLFSDNFESYTASPTPVIDQNNPPNAAQYAPPTPPWYAASGSGCTDNCEDWGGVPNMGPDTIWAVTTERAYSGTKSLELGMNDIAVDKTEAHMYLPQSQTPMNGTLHWTQDVWFSQGFGTRGNTYTLIMYGGTLTYKQAYGYWFYAAPSSGKVNLVPDEKDQNVIPLQQWVQLDMIMDMTSQTYQGVCVDGVQVLPNLVGQPFASYYARFKNSGIPSIGEAFPFGMWLSGTNNDQSRAKLGDDGEFTFIDDVALWVDPSGSVACAPSNIQSSLTSTNTTQTFSTSTSAVSELPEYMTPIVIVALIMAVLALSTTRRFAKRFRDSNST